MKRAFSVLFAAVLLAGLLAACSKEEASTSAPSPAEEENISADVTGEDSSTAPEEPQENVTEEEPAEQETPAADKDVNELYEALAAAAGLDATLEVTMLDLNAGGGITTDNILEMAAGQSKVGGDSGLVIVLYVKNGTVDTMVKELEGYRDSLIGGPAYDEFADAKEATENARIEAFGNYVVYAATSADAGASYDDVDTALVELFA